MLEKHLSYVEMLHMQWALLHLAVQLDQRWLPSLRQQSDAAVDEVFSIAQKLAGVKRDFANLGELRKHLLERIVETGSSLAEGLSAQPVRGVRFGLRKRRADDVLFIARTLDRCVGMRSGELTVNPGAQRALWAAISSTRDSADPPRRGPELIRHTCSHVLTRLEDWLEEERDCAERPFAATRS
jgi:hypothetical protein